MERANAWKSYSDQDMGKLDNLCDDYKAFISHNKTERECVSSMIALAEACGYVPLDLVAERRRHQDDLAAAFQKTPYRIPGGGVIRPSEAAVRQQRKESPQ